MLNPSINKHTMITFTQINFMKTGLFVSIFLLWALSTLSVSAAEVTQEQIKGLDEQDVLTETAATVKRASAVIILAKCNILSERCE